MRQAGCIVSAERAGCPYVGPRPFERADREVFFGRSREIDDLVSLITAHRVVLLYAESGAGKTSLLNAGLGPQLEAEGFQVLPSARVFGQLGPDVDPRRLSNPFSFNVMASLTNRSEGYADRVEVPVADVLGALPRAAEGSPRVLVVDQFEELFTGYPDRWTDRRPFVEEIRDALDRDPLLRVALAIREDYLGRLTSLARLLPERLRTRYRLERLRKPAALRAIRDPLKATKRSFAEGVAEWLVDDLMSIRVESDQGDTEQVKGEFVEPVQLQVVCQQLWDHLPEEVQTISTEHLRRFGDANQALAAFYEERVVHASRAGRTSVRRIRRWFERWLITPAGTRGTIYRGEKDTGGLRNEAVDDLERSHVIRGEIRAGARWYELTHDRFVDPIRSANAQWLGRRRRRLWSTVLGAFGICLAAVGALVGFQPWGSIDAPPLASPSLAYVSLYDYDASPAVQTAIDSILVERYVSTAEGGMTLSEAQQRLQDGDPAINDYVLHELHADPLEIVLSRVRIGIQAGSEKDAVLVGAALSVHDLAYLDSCLRTLDSEVGGAGGPLLPVAATFDMEMPTAASAVSFGHSLDPPLSIARGSIEQFWLVLGSNDAWMNRPGMVIYDFSIELIFEDGPLLSTGPLVNVVPTLMTALQGRTDAAALVGTRAADECGWTNAWDAQRILSAAQAANMSESALSVVEALEANPLPPRLTLADPLSYDTPTQAYIEKPAAALRDYARLHPELTEAELLAQAEQGMTEVSQYLEHTREIDPASLRVRLTVTNASPTSAVLAGVHVQTLDSSFLAYCAPVMGMDAGLGTAKLEACLVPLRLAAALLRGGDIAAPRVAGTEKSSTPGAIPSAHAAPADVMQLELPRAREEAHVLPQAAVPDASSGAVTNYWLDLRNTASRASDAGIGVYEIVLSLEFDDGTWLKTPPVLVAVRTPDFGASDEVDVRELIGTGGNLRCQVDNRWKFQEFLDRVSGRPLGGIMRDLVDAIAALPAVERVQPD